MRTPSGTLGNKFDDTTTTLARIWDITRKDTTVVRLTDHDQDLAVGGDTYLAAQGFSASSILISAGEPVQGMEMIMPEDTTGVDGDDVDAGLYDGAQCSMRYVDYEALAGGAMTMFGGVIGHSTHDRRLQQINFTVEGKFSRGRVVNVESWSSTCRADLGDARCTVDIEALKTGATVTSVPSQYTFVDSSLALADDAVALGVVKWLTGANAGLAFEIKGNVAATDRVTTFMPAPFVIQVGDTCDLYPGCNKSLSTCRDTYNNVVNFRGEPFIPNGKIGFQL